MQEALTKVNPVSRDTAVEEGNSEVRPQLLQSSMERSQTSRRTRTGVTDILRSDIGTFIVGVVLGVIVRLLFGLLHGIMPSRARPSAADRQTVPLDVMSLLSNSLLNQAKATKAEVCSHLGKRSLW